MNIWLLDWEVGAGADALHLPALPPGLPPPPYLVDPFPLPRGPPVLLLDVPALAGCPRRGQDGPRGGARQRARAVALVV
eukprot:4062255-Pyramimonas_sp.AAC.1